ncbi:hypothetical protein [Deinococcus sp.]|uniref:hypothetical protein n=1 Tax=Deinococcus sp. TaxID=47478 RepID=UPI002869E0EF|nr:hypothetical protein [Deinococcus sp.]
MPTPITGMVSAQPGELIFSNVVVCPTTSTCPDGLQSLTVTNTGTDSATITGWTFTGLNPSEFEVITPAALPVTVEPGAALTVQVHLKGQKSSSAGVFKASLNAVGTAFSPVGLSGLRANSMEGTNEPPMGQIADALGIKMNVGWPGLESSTTTFPLGDEVINPMFVKAGSGTVSMTPVARYSPDGATPFGYFTLSGTAAVRQTVGTLVAGQYQTLNPAVSGSTTFDPGTAAFGTYIDPQAYGYKFTYTKDSLNEGKTAHAVRVYPFKDSSGVAVANAYLLAFEPSVNGDYQDAVFVIRNVKPAP